MRLETSPLRIESLSSAPAPVLNYEFSGVSDLNALQSEVNDMRDQLAAANEQSTLDRRLADQVLHARQIAILSSPALCTVFGVDEAPARREPMPADAKLSSAFATNVSSKPLPEGLVAMLSTALRVQAHPDKGGDLETAQTIAKALEDADHDPTFAVATAMLHSKPDETDIQALSAANDIDYTLP